MARDESKKIPELKPREVKVIRALSDSENQKLRVAAYCRVSTDSEDQVNSFIAQVKYYNDFIRLSDTMELVDIYADEGITGTSTEKRDEFNRMIRDCKLGKINRVFVKSVSRFARNSLECIENIRLMKSYGTTVLFENDGLDTSNMNSEMILCIKSAFAQSESLSGSKRVSTAIRMRMETGKFVTTTAPFGYRLEDKKLAVNPEEAEIVRKIFNMYLDGASVVQIKTFLEGNGIKTRQGKDEWSTDTIRKMLQNEKYTGDVIYQKTFRTDPISKRTVINRGEKEKYLVSNNHPAIIDRDTFVRVQTEIVRRSSKRKTWTQKRSEKRIYWRCLSRIDHGKKFCKSSKGIEEKKLHGAICSALKRGIEENKAVYSLIEANLTYAISGEENSFDVYSLEQHIAQKQAEASDLVKLSMKSGANAEKYEAEIAKMYSEIKVLREQLKQAQEIMQKSTQTNGDVARISEWLNNHDLAFDEYDDVVVRRLVDTIKVNIDDTITLTLKGGIVISEELESKKE